MKSLKEIVLSCFSKKEQPKESITPTYDTIILPVELESELNEKEKKAVLSNLELMTGTQNGSLFGNLLSESMGGNAGSYQGDSCSGQNFAYTENGEIKYFSNEYGCPDQYKQLPRSAYRVACNFSQDGNDLRIIQILEPHRIHFNARRVLIKSIEAYNELYGFTKNQ